MKSNVSIIVPIYNSGNYLRKCLNSLINQTYSNIEIILINDGSTDNSQIIAEEYKKKDKRIKLISILNSGVSSARNLGLDLANGEYIIFVDSDDWIESTLIEEIMKYKHKIDNNGILVYSYLLENIDLGISKPIDIPINLEKKDYIEKIKYLIKTERLNALWNKVYKREIIERNNIRFNNKLSLGEDLLFNYIYFMNIENIYFLDKILYHYSIRDNDSLTKKFNSNKIDELIEVLNEISKVDKNIEIQNSLEYIKTKNIYSCIRDLYSNKCIYSTNEKINFIKYMKKNIKIQNKLKIESITMRILAIFYSSCNPRLLYSICKIVFTRING